MTVWVARYLLATRSMRFRTLRPVKPLKVFDIESCQRRLSGGYITLLFKVAAGTDAGRELLANAGLWKHLASMGAQVQQFLTSLSIKITRWGD